MKLINAATLKIHEFPDADNVPAFAILSHRWGNEEECSFQMWNSPDIQNREGYRKTINCCDQALEDGLEWAWVDRSVITS